MSGRMQELTIVFDREQQTFMHYLGVPWEPLGDEIRAAERAVEAAGAEHGLRLEGPDEIRRPVAAPHAVLLFRWGYPGSIESFPSEEPLTESEQGIVAAAFAAVPGWYVYRKPSWLTWYCQAHERLPQTTCRDCGLALCPQCVQFAGQCMGCHQRQAVSGLPGKEVN